MPTHAPPHHSFNALSSFQSIPTSPPVAEDEKNNPLYDN